MFSSITWEYSCLWVALRSCHSSWEKCMDTSLKVTGLCIDEATEPGDEEMASAGSIGDAADTMEPVGLASPEGSAWRVTGWDTRPLGTVSRG